MPNQTYGGFSSKNNYHAVILQKKARPKVAVLVEFDFNEYVIKADTAKYTDGVEIWHNDKLVFTTNTIQQAIELIQGVERT